jgi:hypothetical protein
MSIKLNGVIKPLAIAIAAIASGAALAAQPVTQQDLQALQAKVDSLSQQLASSQTKSSDLNFRLAGTVATSYTKSDQPGNVGSFMGGAFMPIFLARYKDILQMESHIEFINHGDTTSTSLEYAQLDLFASDYATIVAGKFLSPLGQFQQSLHPAWINKLTNRPAGFVEDGGAEPLSDVGLQVRGATEVGSGDATVNYAVYLGNGPQLNGAGGLSLGGHSMDDNNNKAFGGRIGVRPVPDVSLGLSAMTAQVKGFNGVNARYKMFGADLSYTHHGLDIKGELISSKIGNILTSTTTSVVPSTKWNLWYLQAAYRLSGVTDDPTLGKFEPVLHYGRYKVTGGALGGNDASEKRTTIGLNYWFAPTLVAKLDYEKNNYDFKPKDNVIQAQLAYGF